MQKESKDRRTSSRRLGKGRASEAGLTGAVRHARALWGDTRPSSHPAPCAHAWQLRTILRFPNLAPGMSHGGALPLHPPRAWPEWASLAARQAALPSRICFTR